MVHFVGEAAHAVFVAVIQFLIERDQMTVTRWHEVDVNVAVTKHHTLLTARNATSKGIRITTWSIIKGAKCCNFFTIQH